ncbi:unnamed protein product [Closterium sp. Yama58-4]|nr:unnamed protein product [Closterium sp. Yama58-4]
MEVSCRPAILRGPVASSLSPVALHVTSPSFFPSYSATTSLHTPPFLGAGVSCNPRMQALGVSSAAPCAATLSIAQSDFNGLRLLPRGSNAITPPAASHSRNRLPRWRRGDATAEENYREAARLRDAIREVKARDPVRRLQQQLEAAIAGERYKEAAALKEELARIAPPPPPPPPPPALPASSCTSDTLTEVRFPMLHRLPTELRWGRLLRRLKSALSPSVYVRHRSDPDRSHFFFAYRVRITNEGSRVVRLVSRHWLITNGKGRVEHVRGSGVVGQQPVLPPGASFEYTSVCPLDTRKGAMEGEFEMVDVATSAAFEVKIGAFALDVDQDGF